MSRVLRNRSGEDRLKQLDTSFKLIIYPTSIRAILYQYTIISRFWIFEILSSMSEVLYNMPQKFFNDSYFLNVSYFSPLATFFILLNSDIKHLFKWWIHHCSQGRRPREDWGDGSSPKLEVGTAHASVPPIFWEAILSDGRESTNRVKKVSSRNSFLK